MTSLNAILAAVGGLLIGTAAVLLMAATGRIAGVSGIVSRLLPPYSDRDAATRLAFVAGLMLAPWIYGAASATPVQIDVGANAVLLVLGGLLVGFGAVLGSGCTSGHGVCGTARLSRRSLAATAVFMATGIATVFLLRHGFGG
jgi:uncharacterized membrane protein YedE/YeeE